MKPICVQCHRFYRPKKNGFYFIEGMPASGDAPAGLTRPDQWSPYKLWAGDLYECEGCGAQTIVGVPREPISEHYKPEFKELVQRYDADYQVNDC